MAAIAVVRRDERADARGGGGDGGDQEGRGDGRRGESHIVLFCKCVVTILVFLLLSPSVIIWVVVRGRVIVVLPPLCYDVVCNYCREQGGRRGGLGFVLI